MTPTAEGIPRVIDPGRTMRILVVDDDPAMVRLARGILQASGFTAVSAVGTAREALGALGEADVVLLDHQLPDTSGLEILEAIRDRPDPPAVIMVTAHGNESLAAAALRRGADDYLAKDTSLAELLPQVLERVRRTRELRKALVAAERDLVRAERLGAIGEMTVTLHHEINNPLMSALADVQLLLADFACAPDLRRETLCSIEAALRRIAEIVRRIGDLREARTKTYIGGTEMIDLAAAPEPG
ncbi:MAG TPA: response regulator, partial [Gemmatimonadales bacterium]